MSMERGGFGNVARSASFVERVCLAARCARDRWAGAAAAAAGAGTRAAADLLTSARRTLVAVAAGRTVRHEEAREGPGPVAAVRRGDLHFCWVPSSERAGCARRCASAWALSWHTTGAFVGLALVREPSACMWSARDSVVRTHVVMRAAELRACALVAWVTFGWAALVGMRDAGARGGRAGAGRRLAQRRALR